MPTPAPDPVLTPAAPPPAPALAAPRDEPKGDPNTDLGRFDPVAGLLSYALPGLGQIVQGRVGKGVLFFVSLWGLFFYGMYLGRWANVYIPESREVVFRSNLANDLFSRPQFAGQFFIGVAAWPAVAQYRAGEPPPDEAEAGHPWFGHFQRAPRGDVLNDLQRDTDKRWDLGWVYTVIAGVLNILVIYDAVAGPAVRFPFAPPPEKPAKGRKKASP